MEHELIDIEATLAKLTLRQNELRKHARIVNETLSTMCIESGDSDDISEQKAQHNQAHEMPQKYRDMMFHRDMLLSETRPPQHNSSGWDSIDGLSRTRLKAVIRGLRSDMPVNRDSVIFEYGDNFVNLSLCTDRLRETVRFVHTNATCSELGVLETILNAVVAAADDDAADQLYRVTSPAPHILQWPDSP